MKKLNAFFLNGYHYKFIEEIKNKIMRKINQTPLKCSNEEKTDIYWHLSFLKSTETSNSKVIDKINTILSPSIKLNVAYQTKKTKVFFPNKDKISKRVSSNVLYKYQCSQCPGLSYIGETKIHLLTRTEEHVRGQPTPSEVSPQ